jgi:hypothetical protein
MVIIGQRLKALIEELLVDVSEEAEHLARVLRLREGDEVVLGAGDEAADFGVADVEPSETEGGVEFVRVADGLHARVVFGDAAAEQKVGFSAVSASGGDGSGHGWRQRERIQPVNGGGAKGNAGGRLAVARLRCGHGCDHGCRMKPMAVLIACDKFKGTLTAGEACAALRDGLLSCWPGLDVRICPIADGGEGTADVLRESGGGEWRVASVRGPLGPPVPARGLFGSFAYGQPNWIMKLLMIRWKWMPS